MKLKYSDQCCVCGKTAGEHQLKDKSCPSCGAGIRNLDWHKPVAEAKLFLLQKEFLKTRDVPHNIYLGQMFEILLEYAKGKIKKMVNGAFNVLPDLLHERASDAANLIIDQYFLNPSFEITTSFGGLLEYKVRQVLYGYKVKIDDDVESLQALSESTNIDWLIGLIGDYPILTTHSPSQDFHEKFYSAHDLDLLEGVMRVMVDGFNLVRDQLSREEAFATMMGIYHYLRFKGDKTKVARAYSVVGVSGVEDIVNSLLIDVQKFLRKG